MTSTDYACRLPDDESPNPAEFTQWFNAICDFTRPLVDEGEEELADDEGDLLKLFADRALIASQAESAALYLPTYGGQWVCEVVARAPSSPRSAPRIGQPLDLAHSSRTLLDEGQPVTSRGALHVPIKVAGKLQGCLTLIRNEDAGSFSVAEQNLAMAFARQGALALDLIGSRQAHGVTLLLEERARISRDLHDLGIQHLFATGMMLQSLREKVDEGLSARRTRDDLDAAMQRLDEAVRQIRNIVYRLRDDDEAIGLVEAIEREASVARSHLGFAPTIIFEVEGEVVRPGSEEMERLRQAAPDQIGHALTEDIVAVVRESLTNIARHAGARSAQVQLNLYGAGPTGEIEVLIVDDGAGVDPSQSRSSGMANMQRRAANHGGSFGVSAGPRGRGTSLVWRAPLG